MRYMVVMLLLASPTVASDPVYSWQAPADHPECIDHYRDGKLIGRWDTRARQYRTFDGTNWGAPTDAVPALPMANRGNVVPAGNRVIVTPLATPQVMVMPQPYAMSPPLRGPLRRQAGNIFAQIMLDGTMKVIDAIPGAIVESLKNGNYQLNYQYSVTPSPQQPQQPEVQPNPPIPSPPAQGPLRRWVMPRP